MTGERPVETSGGFRWRLAATKFMSCAAVISCMSLPLLLTVLQLGELASPPALVVGLALLALVILVGRVVLAVAWRLVLIALVIVTLLWILGVVGLA